MWLVTLPSPFHLVFVPLFNPDHETMDLAYLHRPTSLLELANSKSWGVAIYEYEYPKNCEFVFVLAPLSTYMHLPTMATQVSVYSYDT